MTPEQREEWINRYDRSRENGEQRKRKEERYKQVRALLDQEAEDTLEYWQYAELKGWFKLEADTPQLLKHWARLTVVTTLLGHSLDSADPPLYWGMEDAVTVALNALEDVNMHTERRELAEKLKAYRAYYGKSIRFVDLETGVPIPATDLTE